MLKGFHLQEKVFLTNNSTTPIMKEKLTFIHSVLDSLTLCKKCSCILSNTNDQLMVSINL